MSTPTDPLDALIASYVQAIEAGHVPNRRELLDRNPEHAEALITFFADFDRMDRVASPLRIAGEIDETAALDGNGLSFLPSIRYFGDYELLEEIARGGMGIVYKARQTSLNRLVALKLILTGTFATLRDVARFQAEAEAAANLDHPHIVPVYEVGEHEGQQYFSMKFVEGGSLANHPRGEVKAEVQGLITITRAVHHAHQHGVLHRRLKPSNVLVDTRGDRHVTDFGLAKRLTDLDRSLTEAGQILGTPRYMSPEQAAGRKDLTVATDIYALGVILYERLTGRTPFSGENVLTMLRQVRETEPPRPSSICPGFDRDLETVVLKCLDKDPARRYATAEEMAQDLAHWLEGRPIAARPVGQAEKFARWCRRNPAVAGLAASVLLVLILGTVVSSLFAYQERKARIRAESAEDNTERAFARSLARPLNPKGSYQLELSSPEVEVLWELSSEGSDSLRSRFLMEAARDSYGLRQLYERSEPALIAAVGLDPERRTKAVRHLVEYLRQPGLTLETRLEIAFVLIEILEEDSPFNGEVSTIIVNSLPKISSPEFRNSIDAHIINSCDTRPASNWLRIVVAALESSSIENTEIGRMLGTTGLLTGLESLSRQLEPRVAGQLARSILAHLEGERNLDTGYKWYLALATLSDRLELAEAKLLCGRASRALAHKIEQAPAEVRYDLLISLAKLTARLDPTEASAICGPTSRAITESIERDILHWRRAGLAEKLALLSDRLDVDEASEYCGRAARAIVSSIEKVSDSDFRSELAKTLPLFWGHLDSDEATTLSGRAAEAISQSIEWEKNHWICTQLAEAHLALSSRLDRVKARTLARSIASNLEVRLDVIGPEILANLLVSLSAQLDSSEAETLCTESARAITLWIEEGKEGSFPNSSLAKALATMSVRLNPVESATLHRRAARAVTNSFDRVTHPFARFHLARALALLSDHLDPAEASNLCSRAAHNITRLFEQTKENDARFNLSEGLALLAVELEPGDTRTIARDIAGFFDREADTFARLGETTALESFLLSRLESSEIVRDVAFQLCSVSMPSGQRFPYRIQKLLTIPTVSSRNQLAIRYASQVLQYGPGWAFPGMILKEGETNPCRLTTAELVELLKMPTCFGETRRVVLDQLETIHGRRFANHWEFVRFAREKGLKLDFTSPPRRPDPKASLGRLLDESPGVP